MCKKGYDNKVIWELLIQLIQYLDGCPLSLDVNYRTILPQLLKPARARPGDCCDVVASARQLESKHTADVAAT